MSSGFSSGCYTTTASARETTAHRVSQLRLLSRIVGLKIKRPLSYRISKLCQTTFKNIKKKTKSDACMTLGPSNCIDFWQYELIKVGIDFCWLYNNLLFFIDYI